MISAALASSDEGSRKRKRNVWILSGVRKEVVVEELKRSAYGRKGRNNGKKTKSRKSDSACYMSVQEKKRSGRMENDKKMDRGKEGGVGSNWGDLNAYTEEQGEEALDGEKKVFRRNSKRKDYVPRYMGQHNRLHSNGGVKKEGMKKRTIENWLLGGK